MELSSSEIKSREFLFEAQVTHRLTHGFHNMMGLTEEQFLAELEPLSMSVPNLKCTKGNIPFTLVIPETRVSRIQQLLILQKICSPLLPPVGAPSLDTDTITPYQQSNGNSNKPYLLVDIDTGEASIDIQAELRVPSRCCYWLNDIESLSILIDEPKYLHQHRFDCFNSRYGNNAIVSICPQRSMPILVRTELEQLYRENHFPSCRKKLY